MTLDVGGVARGLLTWEKQEHLVKLAILILAAVLSFATRLFSVLRFESVIHEFDPYFNYRTTRFLAEQGFYKFHNWFDDRAWYPLGRIIGGTIYPGLMLTSAALYRLMWLLNVTIDIRNVCVFLAPFFSSLTTLVTYALTKEIHSTGAGLVAAALISIVPGYISRSVAGSYDNEGIAIFCMLFTYYLWIKAVKTGTIFWSDHALGTFGLCQIHAFVDYLRSRIPKDHFDLLFKTLVSSVLTVLFVVGTLLTLTGKVSPWTGRFYSLLDPSYAKNHIPIIASVSEHQPTSWSSFYFDLQILVFLFPAGLYFCFSKLTDSNIFIILYGVTSIYFAGVMVRLMLVLAPVMCVLSGIAISHLLAKYIKSVDAGGSAKQGVESKRQHKKLEQQTGGVKSEVAIGFVGVITLMLIVYTLHCTWVTSEAYSSPSIVLSARSHDGGRIIFDDFREAYYWLQMNTPEDARIMSWWDYGYQITAMANRTILVDNNTWNNTHISRVGQAMASSEEKAYEIMRELDVDYVLVIFGGLTGYSSDDINKFLWMVRIGGSTDRGAHIREKDYYAANGEFRVDKEGSPTLLNCLMYKMCYYRFGQMYTEGGKAQGYDRVRAAEIGNKDFELDVLEEAYTTEHWLVRIYKVKDLPNRGV
ncbi:hypothetical protein M5D96_012073 [Drosophila gunungcola]|uniref:Dolichyl-diphosphooligosaccharide--protein glycosyltransferase subunit STT3A n=1 Tax=Drosophila gunungcola TaxID=103775 RepID=A0A9P9YE66_9MUSC|nr:hypothetical protein M5D96_012073 [Drosophila gunungcola]